MRLERLEPSILAAADFKSAVYTIPPQSHIIGTSKKSESFQSTDQANTVTLCFLLIAVLADSALTGTPGLIRTDIQLLLRESALPISVQGY